MKTKIKSVLQKITAGALALVFAGTIALPKAEAVTGVDDVSVGIMAVLVHLDSIGGSLAVQQGTALATRGAVTALAEQAAAAGVFGAGVTGAGALAAIGGAVTAAAVGGFTIGYVGYQQLSKLAEWIRQSKLTGTAENAIWVAGGDYGTLTGGGTWNANYVGRSLDSGKVYSTEGGSSFFVNIEKETVENTTWLNVEATFISSSSLVQHYESYHEIKARNDDVSATKYGLYPNLPSSAGGRNSVAITPADLWRGSPLYCPTQYNDDSSTWEGYLVPVPDVTVEKQEVTYLPPVTWSPPAPTLGQDVYYNPYPNMPDKPIKDIVEDVPKDIYDKKFDPAPPSILDPSIPPIDPPAPDIPPVNPNPDVTAPDDVKPYTVRLGDVFPFCIPFDVYHMVTLFAAEPEAPHAKWEFSLPFTGGSYEVEWDLREWDEVAALCRKLELILFCVGLAVVTYKYIKW